MGKFAIDDVEYINNIEQYLFSFIHSIYNNNNKKSEQKNKSYHPIKIGHGFLTNTSNPLMEIKLKIRYG